MAGSVAGREILVYPDGRWRFMPADGTVDPRYREGAAAIAVIPFALDPRLRPDGDRR